MLLDYLGGKRSGILAKAPKHLNGTMPCDANFTDLRS